MAKINIDIIFDPTLEAMDDILLAEKQKEKPRQYLGASQIGEECWRKLFYSYRNAEKIKISRENDSDKFFQEINRIKTTEDGYCQEKLIIKNLKKIEGIELYDNDGTVDENGNLNQIGFKLLLDHFKGHVDFVILGIKQAPKTWHVGEVKCRYEKFFNQLKKLKSEKGEKNALQEWSEEYYAQAQILMHTLKMERHYLICCTPGGREHISVRTDYNKKYAENLIIKAKSIIFDNILPSRLSEKREFYKCKWCEFLEICHDGKVPLVNCKTCRYIEPIKNGQFFCHKKENIIENFDSCNFHIHNPLLINAKLLEHQEDGCIYKSGYLIWANICLTGMPDIKSDIKKIDKIYTSQMLRNDVQYIFSIK